METAKIKNRTALTIIWLITALLWLAVVIDSSGKDTAAVLVVKKSSSSDTGVGSPDDESAKVLSDSGKSERINCVDINNANREQLMSVKGIGPVIADRIIESRTREGPFRQLSDLERVKGIGSKSVRKIGEQFCY